MLSQSLLSLLITPEQFARVVVLDRLYKDVSNEHLRGMMNSIIFREDADANEFIAAIAELEFGYETFADYLADRAEEVVGECRTAVYYLGIRVILNFFFCAWRTPGVRPMCAPCAPHVRQAWRRWLSALQLGVLKLAGGVAEWVLRYSGDR